MTAHDLLLVNLLWYVILTLAFAYEQNWGNVLYFLGAFVLTVGVYIK